MITNIFKMKFRNLFLLSFIFIAFSCNTSTKSELDSLYDELVELHDAVMPKTMAIGSITRKMVEASENASEEVKTEVEDLKQELSDIDDRMNTWMIEFGDAMHGEESLMHERYLKLQTEIKDLKKDTDKKINEAKKLTEKLNK